mgnify:FL=1
MRVKRMACLGFACLLCLAAGAGCGGAAGPSGPGGGPALVVYSPHPLDLINPIIAEFEASTGISVKVYTAGTGRLLEMVEKKEEPLCDVLWGGSLSVVMPKADLFEDYTSVNEGMVQEEFRNGEGNLTRFTDLPSVLMINLNLIGDCVVEGYADLLQPQLRGRIAMCDPAVSSSAQEHLINMLYAMGEGDPEAGWEYVEAFCKNLDGRLLDGSAQVYRGVAQGLFAVGLTFEEGASHYVAAGAPIRIVYMEEGVISTPDGVYIVKDTPHRQAARAFADFVTGKDAQTVIAASLGRRSVRVDVEEPFYLPDKSTLKMLYDDKELVAREKESWIRRFGEIFADSLPPADPP